MHIHKNKLMDQGYLPDDLPSLSAIVVAPTGQGKTYLLRKMAENLDLNLITIDCSTLAAEGWKGVGLSQRLMNARKEAANQHSFDRSVLFLDEVDKLHFWGTGSDQGNPMSNILQLYNAGSITAEGSGKEAVNIDVRRFTVLLGGAFEGIHSIIENRLSCKRSIGFGRDDSSQKKTKADLIQQVTHEDLAAYGMLPELLGRIGTILTIPPLRQEDFRQLLCAQSGSIQVQYRNYLKGLYGVDFSLTETAVAAISEKCLAGSSGTRAVNPIVSDLMRNAIAAVERDQAINQVIIDGKDGSLFVTYTHGQREYCSFGTDRSQYPEHTIRASSTAALASKLCRYYKKAGGNMDNLPELKAFLECSLAYLWHCSPPSDFCFFSLERLTSIVHRGSHGSRFEQILSSQDAEACRRFMAYYTVHTQRNLTIALQQIMGYLESYHKKINVRFALKAKRTQ